MSECCQNTVTPRMIKAGQVEIGNKINLEDEEAIAVHGPAPVQSSMQTQNTNQSVNQNISGIPGGVLRPNESATNCTQRTIDFESMTNYMLNTKPSGTTENPSVILPQSPLSPSGYQEELDNSALQSFNGFLRTQIGRYVRIQQLVTSDRTEDRLGFLVGVGSNFVILQDITTGNIMVIDIFSIRLTYVYYSSAVVPEF